MDKEQLVIEQNYLKKVLKEIKKQKQNYENELDGLKKQKKDLSVQYSEDYYTMDDEEALTEGDRLAEYDNVINFIQNNITRLNRQEYSPYFGRVDFKQNEVENSYYIGVNNLTKEGANLPLVCDWRAPVSSLFYDY